MIKGATGAALAWRAMPAQDSVLRVSWKSFAFVEMHAIMYLQVEAGGSEHARAGPGMCAHRAGCVRAQGRVCACARAGVATKRVLQQARELVVAIWHVPCACAAKGAHPDRHALKHRFLAAPVIPSILRLLLVGQICARLLVVLKPLNNHSRAHIWPTQIHRVRALGTQCPKLISRP